MDPKQQPPTDEKTARRRRRPRWWHFVLLLALGFAVTVAIARIETQRKWAAVREQAGPAKSETISYDPETCKTNPGDFVYAALGRVVLKLPADELTNIRGMSAERYAELPQPPDPDEPEGCPNHPLWGSGFSLAYRYEAVLHDKFDPRQPPGTPNRLDLIASRPDQWGLQLFMERQFDSTCERVGTVREELPNGLVACRFRPKDTSIPVAHWSVDYRAKPEVYSAPLGRPFVVGCLAGVQPGSHECQVTYKLADTLNVSYRFWPSKVTIADIIDFDRGLRARIEALIVKDYVWPDEAHESAETPNAGDDNDNR